jgi:hypothetical protein
MVQRLTVFDCLQPYPDLRGKFPMRPVLQSVTAVLLLAASAAQAQEGPPGADTFQPGSGRVWLSGCEYQSERYVTCKDAARPLLDAISAAGEGTPGEKLQTYVSDLFIEKGCAFEAPPESFRVNGIFLSFDAHAAREIRCNGKKGKLVFAPGVITLLDTLYFLSGDPPR